MSETGNQRLPAEIQRRVRTHMIDQSVRDLLAGARHRFGKSTDYDVLVDGRRFPPKAVFGLALETALRRQIGPQDFSAGRGAVSFQLIEAAGYPIVAKGTVPIDDEHSWAEGSRKLAKHLKRERAPGLSDMKKRYFREEHGRLFCERCGVVPSETLGEFGDACIEVHHAPRRLQEWLPITAQGFRISSACAPTATGSFIGRWRRRKVPGNKWPE